MAPHPRDRRDIATTSANPQEPVRCIPCQKWFPTRNLYEVHLLESGSHFTCDFCYADHHTQEGLKCHKNQMHSAEQDLQCPGCHKSFSRLGGLMAHIEYRECSYLKPGYIEELRAQNPRNSGVFEAIRAATAWAAVGNSNANDQKGLNDSPATNSKPSTNDTLKETFIGEKETQEDEDLISFDAPSLILNASWDQPVATFNTAVDFPTLFPVLNKNASLASEASNLSTTSPARVPKTMKCTVANTSASLNNSVAHPLKALNGSTAHILPTIVAVSSTPPVAALAPAISAWNGSVTKTPASTALFPNAPPAVAPPPAVMENLSLTSVSTLVEPIYGDHDPDNPNFIAARYYNRFSRSYKCPHSKCKKNLASVPAFIQHLKSPIHRDLPMINCARCFRLFPNATALTQHIESQAMRCDARKLDYANVIVEDVTQIATVKGIHEDETVRYINLPRHAFNPDSAVAGVVEASRRAVDAEASFKENHWKTNSYTNW